MNHRGGEEHALGIGDERYKACIIDSDEGVGGSEINTDNHEFQTIAPRGNKATSGWTKSDFRLRDRGGRKAARETVKPKQRRSAKQTADYDPR
jgi:hypothetical protein